MIYQHIYQLKNQKLVIDCNGFILANTFFSFLIYIIVITILVAYSLYTTKIFDQLNRLLVVFNDGYYTRLFISDKVKNAKGSSVVLNNGNDLYVESNPFWYISYDSPFLVRVMRNGIHQPISGNYVKGSKSATFINKNSDRPVFISNSNLVTLSWYSCNFLPLDEETYMTVKKSYYKVELTILPDKIWFGGLT